MKKAAYYVRVSTDKQEKEATIESQIDEIEKKIIEDGNVLLPQCKYKDDGWSGSLLARPSLDSMRDSARRKDFDVLYVYDRGRLARKFAYQEIVLEELYDLEIDFITLHDINAETDEERVLQSMQGVFHEYERIKIAERMRRGKMFKTKSGKLLGYNPLYGYDYIPKSRTENCYFVINKEEAKVVRKIFNWVGNEEYTIKSVIKKLNKLKIYPKKKKREYWSTSTLSRLLRNKTYIGEHNYNKTESVIPKNPTNKEKYKKIKKSSRRQRPKNEWIKCEVPAIVDKALFSKVQGQLLKNSRFCKRNKKHNYLLNSLVYCTCGMKRVGQPGGNHYYYRCSERIYKFPLVAKCKEKGINAKVLDNVVWKRINELQTNKGLIKKQAQKWLGSRQLRGKHDDSEVENIKSGLIRLDKEEKRYLKAFGQGLVSINVYERQIKDLNRRREGLKIQLDEIETEQDRNNVVPNIDIDKLCERALATIANFNFDDKINVLRNIINKITGNQEFVLVTGFIPVNLEEKNVSFKTIGRNSRLA